jgi:hypothetical protein
LLNILDFNLCHWEKVKISFHCGVIVGHLSNVFCPALMSCYKFVDLSKNATCHYQSLILYSIENLRYGHRCSTIEADVSESLKQPGTSQLMTIRHLYEYEYNILHLYPFASHRNVWSVSNHKELIIVDSH